jgi:hypothetical protein
MMNNMRKRVIITITCLLMLSLIACQGDNGGYEAVVIETEQAQELDNIDEESPNEDEYTEVTQPADDVSQADLSHIPYGYLSVGYIQHLSDYFYGRSPFSYREMEAAQWIVDELIAMGYEEDDIYWQEFDWENVRGHTLWGNRTWEELEEDTWIWGDFPLREEQLSQNIILTVPGQSDKTIIVGAHYDSVIYPGASDNASGTALLMESAYRMLNHDNYHTIIYIFFGSEEPGLFGVYYYYNSMSYEDLDNLLMMVNADILIEGSYVIFGAGYAPVEYWLEALPEDLFDMGWWNPQRWWLDNLEIRGNRLTAQIDEIALDLNQLHSIELISDYRFVLSPSDHWMFAFNGHTVVNLVGMERGEGENQIIEGYNSTVVHTPQDEFHFINETWPGMMEGNMEAFSILLEGILLATYRH